MEAIIGGAIVGAAVVTLGRPVVSGLADVLSPATDEVMRAGNAAWVAVVGTVTATGAWVSGFIGAPGEDEEGVIERIEGLGKDFVWEMAEMEAATFIKMTLVAAL